MIEGAVTRLGLMALGLALGLACLAGSGSALTADELRTNGYREVTCTFTERCVIGAPCERAWREMRWYMNDTDGLAYRENLEGKLRKGMLMLDARWLERSDARAVVMQMREGVASHFTMFHGGGAIYSLQYAGNPGSGQFLKGQCEAAGK